MFEQREVVDHPFAEAETRIDAMRAASIPASRQARIRAARKALTSATTFVVMRGVLHGAWLALHVHEADARPALRGCR